MHSHQASSVWELAGPDALCTSPILSALLMLQACLLISSPQRVPCCFPWPSVGVSCTCKLPVLLTLQPDGGKLPCNTCMPSALHKPCPPNAQHLARGKGATLVFSRTHCLLPPLQAILCVRELDHASCLRHQLDDTENFERLKSATDGLVNSILRLRQLLKRRRQEPDGQSSWVVCMQGLLFRVFLNCIHIGCILVESQRFRCSQRTAAAAQAPAALANSVSCACAQPLL